MHIKKRKFFKAKKLFNNLNSNENPIMEGMTECIKLLDIKVNNGEFL